MRLTEPANQMCWFTTPGFHLRGPAGRDEPHIDRVDFARLAHGVTADDGRWVVTEVTQVLTA